MRRHLTNQRTDAVAMFVLDPYEVYSIELWPFWELQNADIKSSGIKELMDRAEWTVYAKAIKQSKFQSVLNAGVIAEKELLELPDSVKAVIAPTSWQERNTHPDIRLARRAQTFWQLVKVSTERDVSIGLRRTIFVQAQRLLHLAEQRYKMFTSTESMSALDDQDTTYDEDEGRNI